MTNQIASFISSSATLRRLAVTGLVASALLGSAVAPVQASACYFGQCEQAPAARSSELRVISSHGTWTTQTDGQMTVVSDRFDDGSKFVIVDKNNQLFLAFMYDGWHWQEGKSFPIKIDIDGEVYRGTVESKSATTLATGSVGKEVINALYKGRVAKVEVAGDTFTISTLNQGAAAIDDAIKFQRTSSR